MINYIYCMTKPNHWFDAAEDLYKKNIAKPVIWLGDDYHEKRAKDLFGENILSMQDHVHYPYKIDIKDIRIKNASFFTSQNYLRAKDRCLKMMDRIDLFGLLSRIDRETYFNKLCIIFISAIEKKSPTALIMAEAPHSHAQYLLFEISKYYKIEIAWFNNWMIGPIMNLQNMNTMEYVKRKNNSSIDHIEAYYGLVDNFIKNIQDKWEGNFDHQYMVDQVNELKFPNRVVNFIKKDFELILRQSYRNLRDRILDNYNPINPYNFGIITQLKIKRKRRNNLYKLNDKFSSSILPKGNFIFFALHYEHERNTNPDGDIYHEQLIALLRLRNFIPRDIEIVIKEHPTQIYHEERGPRGRSPLIYEVISSLNGVKLLKYNFDSTTLQKKALFTASITGTASLEAAINGGKGLIFGNAWYKGCPNIYHFDSLESYDLFSEKKIESLKSISDFFKNQMLNYCIPANQNFSAELRNKDAIQENFYKHQKDGIEDLMSSFLEQ